MGLLKAYHIKEESDVEILCERLGYDSVEDPREIKVGNVLIAFFGDDAINKAMRQHGLKRLFLHAAELAFFLPGATEKTRVLAPLTEDLAGVIASLKVDTRKSEE